MYSNAVVQNALVDTTPTSEIYLIFSNNLFQETAWLNHLNNSQVPEIIDSIGSIRDPLTSSKSQVTMKSMRKKSDPRQEDSGIEKT